MTLESTLTSDTALDTPESSESGAMALAPAGTDVTTTFRERVTATSADDTGRWIGARLRAIREQKRLSLVDVERLSGGDLGTSTIGAYERGDRAISVPKLDRIADFYGVPIEQFLPRSAPGPEATRTSPISDLLCIDVDLLDRLGGAEFLALRRYLSIIREQRTDPTSGPITLRGADAVVVAAMFGVATEAIVDRLRALGLLIGAE